MRKPLLLRIYWVHLEKPSTVLNKATHPSKSLNYVPVKQNIRERVYIYTLFIWVHLGYKSPQSPLRVLGSLFWIILKPFFFSVLERHGLEYAPTMLWFCLTLSLKIYSGLTQDCRATLKEDFGFIDLTSSSNGSTLHDPHNTETESVGISQLIYTFTAQPSRFFKLSSAAGDVRGNSMQTAGPKDEFGKSYRLAELQVCPCVSENVNRMVPGKKWDGRVHTARDVLFGKPGRPASRLSCCLVATASSLSPPPPINSEHSSIPWESPHPLYRSTHFPQVVRTMT